MNVDKPKPFKPQTLEPSIQESLRRVSRWKDSGYTKQGATPVTKGSDREEHRPKKVYR